MIELNSNTFPGKQIQPTFAVSPAETQTLYYNCKSITNIVVLKINSGWYVVLVDVIPR